MPHHRESLRLVPLAFAASLALAGCGGGGDSPTAASASPSSGSGSTTSAGPSGSLDQHGLDACNKLNQAGQITGDDVVSKAQRTSLLLQAAEAARQSSVSQIKDVQSLVGGAASGSGSNALDQARGICTGLGWSPS